MRKFIIALAASAVLFMSSARAEFTDAEKVEVVKIVQARQSISSALLRIAGTMHVEDIAGLFPSYIFTLRELVAAARFCGEAISELTESPNKNQLIDKQPRADNIAEAERWAGLCGERLTNASNRFDFPDLAPAKQDIDDAVALVASFDWDLGYLDPYLPSYPAIIGPHGNYDFGQIMLRHADFYLYETFSRIPRWMDIIEVWPNNFDVNKRLANVIESLARAGGRMARALAMGSDVMLPSDRAIVEGDTAAGSGLRPASFFRLLLTDEIVFNSDSPRNWRGRRMQRGVAAELETAVGYLPTVIERVVQVNSIENVRSWYTPAGGLTTYFLNLGDFWRAMDNWSTASTQFYFSIPAPTPAPPGLQCGLGTELDIGTIPPQCVATGGPTPMPPPPGVVCGAGTVLSVITTPSECLPIAPPVVETELLCTEVLVGGACRREIEVLKQ